MVVRLPFSWRAPWNFLSRINQCSCRLPKSPLNLFQVNELNYLRQEFSSHFLTLKKLNRLDKLRTKQCRDNTQARRQQVDSYHLQLQNLLYEVLHLEKEVSKCLQFKSGDEDIDLVSLEEFYRNAPPEISRPVKII